MAVQLGGLVHEAHNITWVQLYGIIFRESSEIIGGGGGGGGPGLKLNNFQKKFTAKNFQGPPLTS